MAKLDQSPRIIRLAGVYPLRNNHVIRQRRSIKSLPNLHGDITLTRNLIRASQREYPAAFRVKRNSNSFERGSASCNYGYRGWRRGQAVFPKGFFSPTNLPVNFHATRCNFSPPISPFFAFLPLPFAAISLPRSSRLSVRLTF